MITVYSESKDIVLYILNLLHITASTLPWYVVPTLASIVVIIIAFLFTVLNTVMVIWVERKFLGRFMDRRAAMHVGYAGLLQNFADGIKLMRKEFIIPSSSDKPAFLLSPLLYISTTLLAIAFLPLSWGFYLNNISFSLILVTAFFSLAPLSIFIGGWASNNKYTLIGGMRSAAQMIAYEIPMILTIISVIILAGSLNLTQIVTAQYKTGWYILPLFIGFIVFCVSILAEVERIPFDLPEAEAELVEGWGTEYGGVYFAFLMLTDYLRGYVGSALAVLLFLGGWTMPTYFPAYLTAFPLAGLIWFLIKVYIVFIIFVWVRASLPRVRIDQLLSIGWKKLLPLAVINLLIAIAVVSVGVWA